ncbi:hypothetical protein L1987_38562 [Smallanthus sonchifolius]|uniref:Uncharacterized protein n=1 Tax=Smallanthus sonchifolius TaxID=185202 RepID=A0ACB9HJV4_9ASTR|nr:hypothetical protein L1987_38562 [Smallanthus sonchifolius]
MPNQDDAERNYSCTPKVFTVRRQDTILFNAYLKLEERIVEKEKSRTWSSSHPLSLSSTFDPPLADKINHQIHHHNLDRSTSNLIVSPLQLRYLFFSVFISAMEEGTKSKDHLISAAAFVEGGTQDACDDACSICLEAFSDNDPPTVTGCKHEFHLQCILEWCQRSSQCPMCWQSISLKDPSSQELLDAIEQERSIANNPSMNTTIFHHPTFGDFELQHLPVSATEAELEERIIQHLAAAAAMGRARHIARREGHRSRTSAQARPRYLGFSAQPSVPSPTRPISTDDVEPTTPAISGPPLVTVREEPLRGTAPSSSSSSVHASEPSASPLAPSIVPARPHESPSTDSRSVMQSSPINHDRAGPSEQNSFSDFKTRVNAISMRYKESITKTTKNWKERLFSRNNNPTDHASKDTGEGSAGIATLSRMMDHLQHDLSPVSNNIESTNSFANISASRNEIMGSRAPTPPE